MVFKLLKNNILIINDVENTLQHHVVKYYLGLWHVCRVVVTYGMVHKCRVVITCDCEIHLGLDYFTTLC